MKSRSAPVIFSLLFVLTYTVCFYLNIALFKYYPLVREFHVTAQPESAGPPISWYGWLAVAFLVSAPIAVLIPRSLGNKIPATVAWLVPAIVLLAVLVYEKRWFV